MIENVLIWLLTLAMQFFIIVLAIVVFITKELYPHILSKIK
jgi:hypothetical protein